MTHQAGLRPDDDGVPAVTPLPDQAPVREEYMSFGTGRLWYWDTGGTGEPIVLLHAATAGATLWGYQQPAFARAGYRVIGYSRRGYRHSDPGPLDDTGTAIADLHLLLDHLGLGRVHLVGTAAGAIVAAAFALTQPKRVRTLSLICSLITLDDADHVARCNALRPPQWSSLPHSFQELGPSYRAVNPAGVAAWEMEATGPTVRQAVGAPVTAAGLAELDLPMLLATGDADLITPPAIMRELAATIPAARTAVITGCGHTAFWERPLAVNDLVLDFLRNSR